jgi:hypothetical protein
MNSITAHSRNSLVDLAAHQMRLLAATSTQRVVDFLTPTRITAGRDEGAIGVPRDVT